MDIEKEKKAIKNLKAFYMEDWNLTEEERDDLDNLVSRIVAVVKTEAQAVPDSPTEKTWDEIHLDPKERLYWSLRSAKKRKSDLNWSHASHQTCVGSTHGRKICEYLGVDPDGKDFVRTQEPAND